ncbi:hypothetical protein TMCBR2_gp060 [Caulobacter phage TMCBR2]|uniref:Uncharacterized protein n=2 Tax=Kronosvirus TaxID=3425745 RepID=A0AAE9ZNL4_9CAUD|nr:hypothetical protein TMCBR2_gp060 [Caulobacter phage TMCBR2]WDS38310.1 hypothetical protein TMCBR3_gp062 [Caulobacter phage TMCBR3]WDS38369.1 hypothetical protein TMCBR4_gp060 [Caulobacter phage TMCBR4]WDS38427.1 hypothetical protein W2_gp059 [Caulobacter phage W2]
MVRPRNLRSVLALLAIASILAAPFPYGTAFAQVAGQPPTIPPATWLSVLVPVLVMMVLQTALGFRFLGKQEGRTESLEKAMSELKAEREADLKGIQQSLRDMSAKLDGLSQAANTQDKGTILLEYRLDQIEKNTEAMMALRDAVSEVRATMTEQHRATTEAFEKMDRRVTNAAAQLSHLGSGKAGSVQAFPAE